MSGTESNSQDQKPKTSRLAIASTVFALITLAAVIGMCFLPDKFLPQIPTVIITMLVSLVLALLSSIKIRRSNGTLKGQRFAVAGALIPAAITAFFVSVGIATPIIKHFMYKHGMMDPILCATNLRGAGRPMFIYPKDNEGKYPQPTKWCDSLVEFHNISENQFNCSGAKRAGDDGRCHYAMNPNCEPNSPPDMVLLFETKGGWNQFGGPEILTAENHKGKGCNILFNDGSVIFVRTDQLGKLKWKAEQKK